MELKEFVSQSLLQIFEGVKDAQEKTNELNGSVAPKIIAPQRDNPSILGLNHNQAVILVNFDVSLNTIDSTATKAGFGLFVAAFGGGAQTGETTANKEFSWLHFSVPVVLPSPFEKVKEQ